MQQNMFCCIPSDKNSEEQSIQLVDQLENNIYYPNINLLPVNITRLIASNCSLQEISGLKVLKSLSYLDISKNMINDISDLSYLCSINYLNISCNQIIFIDSLIDLKFLETLITHQNKIQDFEPLSKHSNFNINWISVQNKITENDIQNYLGFQYNMNEVEQLMNTINSKKKNCFNDPMLQKYVSQVRDKSLTIRSDQSLQSIKFTQYMQIESLYVFQCNNIKFEEVPNTVKKLVINQCQLENITGLEKMNQLIELSLRGNRLTQIGELAQIQNLKCIDLAQNYLTSLENIEQLTQLVDINLNHNQLTNIHQLKSMKQLTSVNISCNKIEDCINLEGLVNIISLNLSNNELQFINFVKHMKRLKNLDFSFNKISNIDVLQQLPQIIDLRIDGNYISSFKALDKIQNKQLNWYLTEQKSQITDQSIQILQNYKSTPDNEKCDIVNSNDITQLGFVDVLKPRELFITESPNISFENGPFTPVKISAIKCNLHKITDIFQLTQVTDLDLSFNSIRDICELEELTNLKSLNLQDNDIYRIQALQSLQGLLYLNLRNNKIVLASPLNEMQNTEILVENNLIVDQQHLSQEIPNTQHYQNYLGPNSTQEQADELNMYYQSKYELLETYKQIVNNNSLTINYNYQLQQFAFVDELNVKILNIQDCTNIKCIQIFQHLKMNELYMVDNYPEIRTVCAPIKLISLTITNSMLTNVIGFELMKQLQYLDLRDNCIISIQQLQNLTNLKTVIIDNNYIQDIGILTTLPYYNSEWIQHQKEPADQDYINYLTQSNSNQSLKDLKDRLSQKQIRSDQLIQQFPVQYDIDMINKYKPAVGNYVIIYSDIQLKNIKFVEQLKACSLKICNCINVQLSRTPSNIISLTIINSKLTNIVGLDKMKQLKFLDLRDNSIILLEQSIRNLENLKTVLIDNNFIQNLEILTLLPNYRSQWIYYQRVPTDFDYLNYIKQTNTQLSVSELKSSLSDQSLRSEQLIKQYPFSYDQEMKTKYKNAVTNSSTGYQLIINYDPDLRDLRFVEDLKVTNLQIRNCENVSLLRAPASLSMLVVNNSNLRSIRGIERLHHLIYLELENNNIININPLLELSRIEKLYLRKNKIANVQIIEFQQKQGQYKNRCEIGAQTEPTEQELNDAW
ncbi:leucine-rich_repeat domain-containing protein [Hexamita inflata]|uniref:Leucine-rich repeat domain-containing protein n=1 Tax=Hexamita inflata TaxID=28002 RepID=A0AA86U7E3_9EUKA|nr:leucine-rich repeat domain-containing protein [Hexamita inflata]